MKKKCWLLIGCLSVLLFLVGCKKEDTAKQEGIKIVTSFYPIYAITKEITGNLNQVQMVHSTQGIHSFEPSVSDIAAIYEADLFIYHANILEPWARKIQENQTNQTNTNVTIMEASKNLPFIRVTGLEDVTIEGDYINEESLDDPHTWTDPILAAQEGQEIAKKLSTLDPKNRNTYEKNAQKLQKSLEKLTKEYQEKFKKVKNKTFVTQHTAFSYLANRFSLKQLGISGISNEHEPTPRQLSEIEAFVKDYHVKTIFAEEHVSPKIAETIAKATQTKVKYLSPLEAVPQKPKEYAQHLKDNLEILYQDLMGMEK